MHRAWLLRRRLARHRWYGLDKHRLGAV